MYSNQVFDSFLYFSIRTFQLRKFSQSIQFCILFKKSLFLMSSAFDLDYGSDWYDSYYSYEEDFPIDELLDEPNHNGSSTGVEDPL